MIGLVVVVAEDGKKNTQDILRSEGALVAHLLAGVDVVSWESKNHDISK